MLLDDIVALLSDQNGSLEGALLKTKVLLHQIGHKELVPWVNNELTGYPDSTELPIYRTVSSLPHGHVTWGNSQDLDYVLPMEQLSEQQTKLVTTLQISSSIGTIEQQVKTYREKHKGLIRNLPPEWAPAFLKVLTPGTQIIKLWVELNMAEVEGIVIQVRSRLLDFALELQGVVGVNAAPQELIEKAATVDTGSMFQTAIFHINTAGGTAIIGSTNIQVNNQKDDIEELLQEIAKLGYERAELEELRQAVLEDKSKSETPSVTEGETAKWYMKALKKVGKGTVNAGIDLVSGVIVKALGHYTGQI